jgi:hypothetical protein
VAFVQKKSRRERPFSCLHPAQSPGSYACSPLGATDVRPQSSHWR